MCCFELSLISQRQLTRKLLSSTVGRRSSSMCFVNVWLVNVSQHDSFILLSLSLSLLPFLSLLQFHLLNISPQSCLLINNQISSVPVAPSLQPQDFLFAYIDHQVIIILHSAFFLQARPHPSHVVPRVRWPPFVSDYSYEFIETCVQ